MAKRLSHQVDLNLLELFQAVYQTRNLTAAGRELGLSQPAMSRALTRLRHAYGDDLFLRQPHGLVPTPFADELSAPVRQALNIVRQTLHPPVFHPATENRVFTLAMSDVSEQVFLPTLADLVARQAPGVRLQTSQLQGKALHDAMADGTVDLAMGHLRLHPEGMCSDVLFTARYACIARRDHPAIHGRLTVDNFRSLGHVIATGSITGHAQVLERILSSPGIGAPIALRVGHFLSIGRIVAQTDYLATVPRTLAATFEHAWGVRTYEPPLPLPPYEVAQSWHERYARDPGLTWLRSLAYQRFFGRPPT
ncbi:HTH-type transcriptional regulator SyrM 1 [Pigmentiphaga humi]|uniref:HTH-type transcriptional regulator SyrM 1 n=1 Tax=Pigmentiphaga humi TaxID=2478468 RepID=A0A3P4AZM3_9BURK|nr:LysR family transcriptional regulator [Pigmentiphaga humi]VCU69222.1 HTH-type transcriptional regulator SyrM 1 [Pigmentiphaga humi]